LTKREFPASLLLFAWLTWAAFVLWHYYARLLQVVMAGRLPTLRDCVLVVIFLVGGGLTVPIAIRSIGVISRLRRTRVIFTTAAIAAVPWLFVHPLLLHRLSSLGISGAPAQPSASSERSWSAHRLSPPARSCSGCSAGKRHHVSNSWCSRGRWGSAS
jgi:hypothetical protein